jgi:hypothetical protein
MGPCTKELMIFWIAFIDLHLRLCFPGKGMEMEMMPGMDCLPCCSNPGIL